MGKDDQKNKPLPDPDYNARFGFERSWRQRSEKNLHFFQYIVDWIPVDYSGWKKDPIGNAAEIREDIQKHRTLIEKMAFVMQITEVPPREVLVPDVPAIGFSDSIIGVRVLYHCKFLPEHFSDARTAIAEARDLHSSNTANVIKWHESHVEECFKVADWLFNFIGQPYAGKDKVRPGDVLDQLKVVQAEMRPLYLSRDFREQMSKKINDLWAKTVQKREALRIEYERKQAEWQARQDERSRKNKEWRERQESNVSRWRDRIGNAEEFQRKLALHIEELEEKRDSARSQDFADRAQGWIDEKLAKLEEVRGQVQELENKIDDVNKRLEDDAS